MVRNFVNIDIYNDGDAIGIRNGKLFTKNHGEINIKWRDAT